MEAVLKYFRDLAMMLPEIKLMDIVDILVVALILYKLLITIQSSGTARIAKAIGFVLLATFLTEVLNLYLLNYLLDTVLEVGLIALVILFQPELRRILERLGGKSIKEILSVKEEQREIDHVIAQTVSACATLAKERTGALIVFERESSLSDYQKSGTTVDAVVSSELLRNIFFTKAALHDGAVLIRSDRIAAAGCVLPLTENHTVSSDLGTRHRAGLGMSEVSDAVVVIVSEETGVISVAIDGMLKRYLSAATLEKLLRNELAPAQEEKTKNPLTLLRRKVNTLKKEDDHDAEA